MGIQAFRLDEHLMARFVGKAVHFIFNRGAVARADPFNHARVHWRAIQVTQNNLVGALVGVRDMAAHLLGMHLPRAEVRHHRRWGIARLLFQLRKIDGFGIDTRRRAGFEPVNMKRQRTQSFCQRVGGRITRAASAALIQPDVDNATQEGTG